MLVENGFTFKKVILAVGKSDLRKGIDGLAAMRKLKYGLEPLEEDTLFLFCGVKRNRVKGLLWAGDRFILLYIRLVDGCFQWPRTTQEARTITTEEFKRLMDGFSIDSSALPRRVPPLNHPKTKRKKATDSTLREPPLC